MADDPLILTLWMDAAAFARFDALRRAHFPPERNLIPAHLTLFHHLPGRERTAVLAAVQDACARFARPVLQVTGLRHLGRGVACTLVSPELAALRAQLAAAWRPWLGPQDRQGFRPHVTVQNKVAPGDADELLARLQAGFTPWEVTGEGLLLWRYLGGPWELLESETFRD